MHYRRPSGTTARWRRAADQAQALAAARMQIDEEHEAARPTQSLSVDDIASSGKATKKK